MKTAVMNLRWTQAQRKKRKSEGKRGKGVELPIEENAKVWEMG